MNILDELKRATETELRRFFVAECTERFLDVRLFIRNVGQFQDERGNVFRAGITGQADCWGYLFRKPWPMPLEIELKNVRTRETNEQKAWKAYCDSNRVPHLKLRALKGETPRQVIDRWVTETGRWLVLLRGLA